MYIRNGKKIDIYQNAVGPDGTQYPNLLTPEWRDALGVVEVADSVKPDPRTHTYTENLDGSLTVTERPLAEVKSDRLTAIRREARTRIEAKYPSWYQNNVALGIYPQSFGDTMKDAIASVIQASNVAEDAVDAATTVADAVAVQPTWPVI